MVVIGLKLVTGEELVAELDGFTNSGNVKLKRALALQMQMTKGGPAAGFIPWSFLIPDGTVFEINAKDIITSFNVDSVVEKQYIQNVTGIDLSSAPSPSTILHS